MDAVEILRAFGSARKVRESAFSIFGPISLLILVVVWAVGLVLSFGLMKYGLAPRLTSLE